MLNDVGENVINVTENQSKNCRRFREENIGNIFINISCHGSNIS